MNECISFLTKILFLFCFCPLFYSKIFLNVFLDYFVGFFWENINCYVLANSLLSSFSSSLALTDKQN